MKVLHIGSAGPIMIPFVDFINANFNAEEHIFLLSPVAGHAPPVAKNVRLLAHGWGRLLAAMRVFWAMQRSEKIVLHGLFNPALLALLALQPWTLKRCYWCIWGGDLYDFQAPKKDWKWRIRNGLKGFVIPKIGHLATYIEEDVANARMWYGARGRFFECIGYESNLYYSQSMQEYHSGIVNVLIGNSADPSNFHIDIFHKILPVVENNWRIYAPLSYGNEEYARNIEDVGGELFGEKFIAMKNFVQKKEYLNFLASVDLALFNHQRQQAMGNAIKLLGMGKEVYLRKNTPQWDFFTKKDIAIGAIEDISPGFKVNTVGNPEKIKNYFSKSNLVLQWKVIFS